MCALRVRSRIHLLFERYFYVFAMNFNLFRMEKKKMYSFHFEYFPIDIFAQWLWKNLIEYISQIEEQYKWNIYSRFCGKDLSSLLNFKPKLDNWNYMKENWGTDIKSQLIQCICVFRIVKLPFIHSLFYWIQPSRTVCTSIEWYSTCIGKGKFYQSYLLSINFCVKHSSVRA